MNNPEINSFNEAREEGLNLKEIDESIRRLSEAQREQLSHEINNQIIQELHRGLEIKKGDELNFLKALTLEGNTITWTNESEANLIHPGDIIKVEGSNILKNGNKIGNVTGFSINESGNKDSSSSNEEQETTLEVRQEQPEEIQNQELETEETQINDTESSSESVEEQRFEVKAYSQDGNIYIIGENGEPEAFSSLNMSEEFRESIESIEESNKMIGNFEMILNTLVKKDNEEYSELQNEFNEKIGALDISSSESIDEIINWVNEKNIELNGEVDLTDDYKVIEYIRTIDSSSANGILAERLFHETDISEEELQAFIENPSSNSESIRQLLGEEKFRELRESIRDKKTQADNYFDESRDDFVRQLIEEQGMSMGEASELVDNQYKESIIDAFVTSYAKNKLLLSYVESLEETGSWHGYEGENKMMEMFSDIQGIGYLDASDSTLDSMKFWGKEGFYILGTQVLAIAAGAVTMGVGYAGVNAVVWGARGHRGVKALQTVSRAANAGSWIAKGGRFGAMSVVGGSAFNVGYQAAQGENPFTSTEGYMESIIYTGAYRVLGKISTKLGWGIDATKPLRNQIIPISRLTALDSVVFSAIGLQLEGVLLEPEEWTAELILQAIVMAAAFRVAGAGAERLRFRKNGDRVEMGNNPNIANNRESFIQRLNEMPKRESISIGGFTYKKLSDNTWRRFNSGTNTNNTNNGTLVRGNQEIIQKFNISNGTFTPTNNTTRNSPLNPNRPRNNPENQRVGGGERREANRLISNDLKKNGSVEMRSGNETIRIVKENNGYYSINGNRDTVRLGPALRQIDDRFKIDYMDSRNLDNILRLVSNGQTINLQRSLLHPGGKLRVTKNGEAFLGKRKLTIEERNQILRQPETRREIIKRKLEQTSVNDIYNNVKNKKGFEKIKGLGEGSIKFGLERLNYLLKTGIFGGLFGVGIEFLDGSQSEELSDKAVDLLKFFAIGAAGGFAISAVKTGGLATWGIMKKGGIAIKKGYDVLPVTKILIGTILVGSTTYYFYNTDSDETEQTTE